MSVFSKQKIKDFFIYGLGQAINIVSPLLILPYIIFMCGEEGLGKVGVGMSLALILSGIIDYGSYINGVKDISINRTDKKILEFHFKSIYLSKFILFLGVFLFFILLVCFVPFFEQDKRLYFYSFFIVVGQFINPIWFFQGIENFKLISFINVTSKVIYIFLVFTLLHETSDYIYVNLFLGLGAIIGNVIGLIWLIKKYSFSITSFELKPAVYIIKNEFSFSISQLFHSVYQYSPILLISYVAGDFVAGQFKVIDQIVSIFKTYLNMFFYFVYANICLEINKGVKQGLKVWKQYNGLNFLFLFFVLSVFYVYADLILTHFKIDPKDLDKTVQYFRIGIIVPFLVSISQPLRQLMFAFSENKIYIKITIVTTILNFVLLLLFTEYYGLGGAFLSIIIIEIIIIIVYNIILMKHFKGNITFKNGN